MRWEEKCLARSPGFWYSHALPSGWKPLLFVMIETMSKKYAHNGFSGILQNLQRQGRKKRIRNLLTRP
jgi:hypothetical protein